MIEYVGPIYNGKNKTWWSEATITDDAGHSAVVRVGATRNYLEDLVTSRRTDSEVTGWFESVFAGWEADPSLYSKPLHVDAYANDASSIEAMKQTLRDGTF